jgi:hypothetical protein
MNKFIKTALDYLGIGLFSLGIIIAYVTLRADNFNLYIFGTGVLLIVIPTIAYFIIEKTNDKKIPNAKRVKDLKVTGIKIPVDLTKCIVRSNNWTTEEERYDIPRVAFLNEISGHSDKNVEMVESNLSRIEYSCDFNGKRTTFLSPLIGKDKITTTILIEMQKETSIYVDRDDNRYYYFDLEFIN